jgi:hypothetical protein
MEKLNITQGEWSTTLRKDIEEVNGLPIIEVSTSFEKIDKDRHSEWIAKVRGNGKTETEDNAKLIADAGTTYNTTPILPSELLKQRNELLEALQEIINTANPTNVSSNKTFMGMDLGDLYVGGCGIPSNKSIHMAINAIKNATNA